MGTHFVLERRVMKSFFVIAVALANVALAQDGCPEHPPCPPPPACAEGEMMCQNETPPTNTCAPQMCPGDCPPPPECPTFHCLASTTKSATGADCPNFCMMPPCQSGAMCPDTYDSNGCLMPPTCSPNIAPCGEFPSWEQVVKACPKSQYDSYGCEVNPECGPNEMMCTSGSYDSTSSCPPKGYCMPATSPNPAKPGLQCPNHCPMPCGQDQVSCEADYDSQGCPMPMTCAASMEMCPPRTTSWNGCPLVHDPMCSGDMSEWCPMGMGPDGCHMGFTCGEPGKCPTANLPWPEMYPPTTTGM